MKIVKIIFKLKYFIKKLRKTIMIYILFIQSKKMASHLKIIITKQILIMRDLNGIIVMHGKIKIFIFLKHL
jgi:hypothetical protein